MSYAFGPGHIFGSSLNGNYDKSHKDDYDASYHRKGDWLLDADRMKYTVVPNPEYQGYFLAKQGDVIKGSFKDIDPKFGWMNERT